MSLHDERMAPEGAIWVCGMCGKTAQDRYGIDGEHSRGWDESCAMHAVLCRDDATLIRSPGGYVTSAEPFAAATLKAQPRKAE